MLGREMRVLISILVISLSGFDVLGTSTVVETMQFDSQKPIEKK